MTNALNNAGLEEVKREDMISALDKFENNHTKAFTYIESMKVRKTKFNLDATTLTLDEMTEE